MTPLVGIGAGGHGKVLVEALKLTGQYDIRGLIDTNRDLWNLRVAGVQVLGGEELLPGLREQGITHAFIGIGSVGLPTVRKKFFNDVLEAGFEIVETIHPRSIVSDTSTRGCGLMVLAGAVINSDAILGSNVIINTGAIIEHDCIIGDHVHVATGARLGGAVTVGDNCHIGLGASIIQQVCIGSNVIVGAGAVVVNDVPGGVVVTGVPAKVARYSQG